MVDIKENRYKPMKKFTLFGRLEKKLGLKGISLNAPYYLFRILYLFFLGLLYVWNTHYHEKILHKIHQLQPIVDGLRVKHMQLQSGYMFDSKQSEVAKRVAPLAIYESKIPPYTIKANKKSDAY